MPDYRNHPIVNIKVRRKMPSGNDIKGYHWATYRKKIKKVWEYELIRFRQPGSIKNFYRLININRYYCTGHNDRRLNEKEYDYDNYIAGMKPLIDSLKLFGLIEDDKPSMLTHGEHLQIPTPGESYVEIILQSPGERIER